MWLSSPERRRGSDWPPRIASRRRAAASPPGTLSRAPRKRRHVPDGGCHQHRIPWKRRRRRGRRRLGRRYVLVNNAGILRDGQLVKYKEGAVAGVMSDEQFDSVISVNLKGVFHCTRAVVPRHDRGRRRGDPECLERCRSSTAISARRITWRVKAGVIGMTRVWARELGKYQIRVNAVAPGFIATDMAARCRRRSCRRCVGRTPLGPHGAARGRGECVRVAGMDGASFVSGTGPRGGRRSSHRHLAAPNKERRNRETDLYRELSSVQIREADGHDGAANPGRRHSGACREIRVEPAALDVGSVRRPATSR